MAPPDLARDAPRLNVTHPFVIGVFPLFGHEGGAALLDRRDRRPGESLGIDEPLIHQPRLDDDAGAVAIGNGHRVFLDLVEKPEGFHFGQDLIAGLISVHAPVGFGHVVVETRVLVENVDHLKVMALADLEIIEVVGRRHLDRARALFRVGVFVGDNNELAPDDGQNAVPAHQVLVAFVVGMNGDGDVAEHGFGPGGGDGDEFALAVFDGILEVPQFAGHLALLNL